MTAQIKLLHNFNPEGLIFKTVWGVFDIHIDSFTILLSNLLIRILQMRITSKAIASDPLKKKGNTPTRPFRLVFWQSNFNSIHKVYITDLMIRSMKAYLPHYEVGFSQHFTPLIDHLSSYVNILRIIHVYHKMKCCNWLFALKRAKEFNSKIHFCKNSRGLHILQSFLSQTIIAIIMHNLT